MTTGRPRRTALVTGASGGIGLEIARLLAADDHDLVLVARSGERLEQIARELRERHGVLVRSSVRDLSAPAAVGALWQELLGAGIDIDILVNNAGVGLQGAFAEQDPAALDAMVQLNVSALTALTRLVLPAMLARKYGRILNVASVAGFQPGGPGMAAYYATKAYVLSFSRALARELRGTGVSATALCPGPTRTTFEERSGASETLLYRRVPTMTSSAVARAGYRGMRRGATVVLPGILPKLLAFGGHLSPAWIGLALNRLLLQRRGP